MLVTVKVLCFLLSLIALLEKRVCSTGNVPNISVDSRIVGGQEADIKHFPYQVSIQYFNQHFCGGALITRDTVLTAAHCFTISSSTISTFYDVKVGSSTTSGTAVQIQSVLVHPNYDPDTIDNDISLIKLKSNVITSDTVALIRLSETSKYISGSYASVSGWGYEQENGTVSPLLRKVDLPITSQRNCERAYEGIINITTHMLCAGFPEGGKDACQGDSGGPLVQNSRLIGVVSFGMGCARKSFPGVYTNVATLLDWVVNNSNYIKNNTQDSGYFNNFFKVYPCRLLVASAMILVLLCNVLT